MNPSFKRPPINEVVLGYSFLKRDDLLVPHYGRFWNEIVDQYPSCQHAAPIVDPQDPSPFSDIPLPRVWFVSADETRLVQLQQDRLIFNWRDRQTGGQYVRFPAIRSEFERVRGLFESFVRSISADPIVPASYSLTYVNVIRAGEGWSNPDELGSVFPDLHWHRENRFLPAPTSLEWKSQFSLPDGYGSLVASIMPGKLRSQNIPIQRFELQASSGSLGGRSLKYEDWVEVAHDWILRAFEDMTSERMREYWRGDSKGDS